jgi:hypothetical protein
VKHTVRAAVAFVALVACFCATMLAAGAARAESPPPTVYLVTVAPGGALYSSYGHVALCVESVGQPEAACYDYGVGQAESEGALFWGTLRGRRLFFPVKVTQSVMMGFFQNEERAIWKQVLPLAPDEARKLASRLESAVASHEGYAYDPAFANCTTQVRDRIDEASSGKLRAGSDVVPPGPTFRDRCEEGLSGKALELAFVSMVIGARGSERPTAWELMFLPYELRDGVERRFGVKPEKLFEPREGIKLATSPSAGRIALVLLGVLLSSAVLFGARPLRDAARATKRWRRTLTLVGLVLATLGAIVWGVSLMSDIPEVQRNAVVAVLVPFDLLLGILPEGRLRRYLEVRLGVVVVVLVLSFTHVIVQPIVAIVVLAGLPLAAVYLALRRKTPV